MSPRTRSSQANRLNHAGKMIQKISTFLDQSFDDLALHDVHEIPGILVELQFQLTLFIHLQLGRRERVPLAFFLSLP